VRRFILFCIAVFTFAVPCFSQYYTGNGGSGMRLGILAPEGNGLRADQGYLPALIQGVLVTNISKYSAISVLDRISLDRVITETLDPTYEDSFGVVTLGHVAQVGYMLTGSLTRTSAGYSLQLNVTDTTPSAKTIASYSQTDLYPHTHLSRSQRQRDLKPDNGYETL